MWRDNGFDGLGKNSVIDKQLFPACQLNFSVCVCVCVCVCE